jgi:hypothetical protein
MRRFIEVLGTHGPVFISVAWAIMDTVDRGAHKRIAHWIVVVVTRRKRNGGYRGYC